MKLLDYLKDNIVYLDGGFGTLLMEMGLDFGDLPEIRSVKAPEDVIAIHRAYYDAGSNIVSTNTFGVNSLKYSRKELEEIIGAAVFCAKSARDLSSSPFEKYIALDIGPLGRLIKPLGDLDFEKAVDIFKESVKIGVSLGVDLVFLETFNDSYETKAAVLAVKECCDLPLFVSNAYGEDGKLMTGASPSAMCALLEGMGVTALGANCSVGPKALSPVTDSLTKSSSLPVILKPNAGLPEIENGRTVFNVSPEEFAYEISLAVKKGVRIVGGCCGTTPEYIKAVRKILKDAVPLPISPKNKTTVSSYTHSVDIGEKPVLIGERINPTGKKLMKEALRSGDMGYLLREASAQEESGAHILDVNVGIPDIDEISVLKKSVFEIQSVTNLPLCIDTSDTSAMEAALRIYNGKPLINSVSGKEDSMKSVFPLAKKYGGVIIALTLDENGIPDSAEGRLAIARKILSVAKDYGISEKDIIFDTLAMAVSADINAANITLNAVKLIRENTSCKTSLGISNVSFGLPSRDNITSCFFISALECGLNAAIMNPFSNQMTAAYRSYLALKGFDKDFSGYIEKCGAPEKTEISSNEDISLFTAISKGLKSEAASLASELLKSKKPLDIISEYVIPALDYVGKGFEEKKIYLPQLLYAAEAAKEVFYSVKAMLPKGESTKCPFVLATVKGDIHDIGKNIVKLLLENYGFNVIDLGKDVPPEKILEATVINKAPIVGLSALMTTTVPAMEETIKLIKGKCPDTRICVGGAVLTKSYAEKIGADMYCSDAYETVNYANSIYNALPKR